MATIKITDLPKDMTISEKEMKEMMGGNPFGGRVLSWLGNPWVLGATVAVAIAVPVAVGDRDSGS